ncbi:ABC transporter permease [Konateibacter massiliensis]|uniref:ABC transporter permease n=1 Tax=Konateibacter massiliensis TaxID=2002841 RepID=UPI000C156A7A|nr:ABC-2 family transporter protein [Konateibacter massiliensis]
MRLYVKYLGIHVKSIMQYKTSFLLTTIGQFLVSFNVFLGMMFMFQRFSNVEGFTYSECLMCFAIVLLAFSLAECFFRGFDGFAGMIGNGEFDRILVRPKGLIFQVISSKIELSRIGRMLQAIVMFVYAVPRSGINWNFEKIATVFLMIFGGTIVFAALFILYAALCFFTLEGLEFMNVFTDGAREYGKYPVNIYGKNVLKVCTYIVPFALFQYYPFLYLTGKSEAHYLALLPLAGCFFLLPCYLLWRLGVRHYKSTGS